jgi:hypothetical protein
MGSLDPSTKTGKIPKSDLGRKEVVQIAIVLHFGLGYLQLEMRIRIINDLLSALRRNL